LSRSVNPNLVAANDDKRGMRCERCILKRA
jgi:hypothetical protein